MGIIFMFLLLATLTPLLFIDLKKKTFAIIHGVLLAGMWIYFVQTIWYTTPAAFSITWNMFYLSLIVAEIGWVMFSMKLIKSSISFKEDYEGTYQI